METNDIARLAEIAIRDQVRIGHTRGREIELRPEITVSDDGRITLSVSNDRAGHYEKGTVALIRDARRAVLASWEAAGVTGLRPVKRNGATILRGGYQNMGSFCTARFLCHWKTR